MKAWNPERELTALLDALSEELLSASNGELAARLHPGAGEAREAVAEMRRRLAAAETGLHLAPMGPLAVQGTLPAAKPQ